MTDYTCNFCKTPLEHTFVDLGTGPLVDAYLRSDELCNMEPSYPLHTYVCPSCFLVQLPEAVAPGDLFREYPYFSSVSSSWLAHVQNYADRMVGDLSLNENRQVIEIASNDGYLLQYFQGHRIPVLGIEPARNVAETAVARGIPTMSEFFGEMTAQKVLETHPPADLLIGNNVLAHVPNLNDFIKGTKLLLAHEGVITMEFPHLLRLIDENQFDMIFHEHFSYLSLLVVKRMFESHGLELFDVEEVATHGGSLRIFARHAESSALPATSKVAEILGKECAAGLNKLSGYETFTKKVHETKFNLLEFLIKAKREGCSVVGYGAAGKAVTLLHYCGIGSEFIDYVADLSPHKQNLYMPGVRLPILSPEEISRTRPDYVLILPWNLRNEIMQQMSHIRSWGGRFVIPIPEVEVV